MFAFAFHIQPVKASETVYIRAEGSVDPPTAPIRRSGDVYTLTGDISTPNVYGIVVERDNIILDGSGFFLSGNASAYEASPAAINIAGRSNVTVENTNIQNFSFGIHIYHSSNIIVIRNNITFTWNGIRVDSSNNNTLSSNSITNSDVGISIRALNSNEIGSFGNTISQNKIEQNDSGIVFAFASAYNTVYGNNISRNTDGVFLNEASYNKLYHNNFLDNTRQEYDYDNPLNFWDDGSAIGGNFWSDYRGVDTTGDGIGETFYVMDINNVDRYPLVSMCKVWKPTFISTVIDTPSTLLGFAVNVSGFLYDQYGSRLGNKTVVFSYTFSGFDTWISVTSANTDSLGSYSIRWIPPATGYFTLKVEWSGNITHYRASNITTLNTLSYQDTYVFSVESNSTVSSLAFNSTSGDLSFTASGLPGTNGYVKVLIAKTLVQNVVDLKVYLDGNQLNYTATSLGDSWLVRFAYSHSTHKIVVSLGLSSTTPFFETPLGIAILFIGVIIAVGVILLIVKKKDRISI